MVTLVDVVLNPIGEMAHLSIHTVVIRPSTSPRGSIRRGRKAPELGDLPGPPDPLVELGAVKFETSGKFPKTSKNFKNFAKNSKISPKKPQGARFRRSAGLRPSQLRNARSLGKKLN